MPNIEDFYFSNIIAFAASEETKNFHDSIINLVHNYRTDLSLELEGIIQTQQKITKQLAKVDKQTQTTLGTTQARISKLQSDLYSMRNVNKLAVSTQKASTAIDRIVATLQEIDLLLPPQDRLNSRKSPHKKHYPKLHQYMQEHPLNKKQDSNSNSVAKDNLNSPLSPSSTKPSSHDNNSIKSTSTSLKEEEAPIELDNNPSITSQSEQDDPLSTNLSQSLPPTSKSSLPMERLHTKAKSLNEHTFFTSNIPQDENQKEEEPAEVIVPTSPQTVSSIAHSQDLFSVHSTSPSSTSLLRTPPLAENKTKQTTKENEPSKIVNNQDNGNTQNKDSPVSELTEIDPIPKPSSTRSSFSEMVPLDDSLDDPNLGNKQESQSEAITDTPPINSSNDQDIEQPVESPKILSTASSKNNLLAPYKGKIKENYFKQKDEDYSKESDLDISRSPSLFLQSDEISSPDFKNILVTTSSDESISLITKNKTIEETIESTNTDTGRNQDEDNEYEDESIDEDRDDMTSPFYLHPVKSRPTPAVLDPSEVIYEGGGHTSTSFHIPSDVAEEMEKLTMSQDTKDTENNDEQKDIKGKSKVSPSQLITIKTEIVPKLHESRSLHDLSNTNENENESVHSDDEEEEEGEYHYFYPSKVENNKDLTSTSQVMLANIDMMEEFSNTPEPILVKKDGDDNNNNGDALSESAIAIDHEEDDDHGSIRTANSKSARRNSLFDVFKNLRDVIENSEGAAAEGDPLSSSPNNTIRRTKSKSRISMITDSFFAQKPSSSTSDENGNTDSFYRPITPLGARSRVVSSQSIKSTTLSDIFGKYATSSPSSEHHDNDTESTTYSERNVSTLSVPNTKRRKSSLLDESGLGTTLSSPSLVLSSSSSSISDGKNKRSSEAFKSLQKFIR